MRISTALVSALVAGGSLSLSLQYASSQQQAAPTLDLAALDEPTVPAPTESAPATADAAPAEGVTDPATTAPTTESQPAEQSQATSTATNTPASTSTTDAQPAPTETRAPAPEPVPVAVEKTVTSDVINYKYGVVQISLTAIGNDITNVTLLQGDASYGRDVAYAALIDATVKTDGINYGNVSGATFTTEAFKKAVTNAIAKL